VVASTDRPDERMTGHWSQSPSLRGSGRFHARRHLRAGDGGESQSPSLRGSGRFTRTSSSASISAPVSIPFIAGQWSLLSYAARAWPHGWRGLNPLHCGAVVASEGRINRKWKRKTCLNPLHCGAVVASRTPAAARRRSVSLNPLHCGAVVASLRLPCGGPPCPPVSIPFIAGQWSLRSQGAPRRRAPRSQSPSLRGSGRFLMPPYHVSSFASRLNPLHCGAVVAST